MKVQNWPGIYVYYVDTGLLSRKLRWYYFTDWKGFFAYFGSWNSPARLFGDAEDIWKVGTTFGYYKNFDRHRPENFGKYYAVYDQDGNWFSPAIIEQYRLEEKTRLEKKRKRARFRPWRHRAYGHYHPISSARSNREDFADEEALELGFDTRQRRKAVPPDSWDREKVSHNDKCWKTQRKTIHQWKAK